MPSHKPRFANRVSVNVYLANGTYRHYSWSTPRQFGYCFGAGRTWAIEELRKEKVPGRSDIREITVTVARTNIVWQEKE